MQLKKYALVYFLISLVGVLFAINLLSPNFKLNNFPAPVSPVVSTQVSGTTVRIDFGDKQKTYTNIQAPNAYLALVEAVKQDGWEVEVEQYDFGLMIKKVGELTQTPEYFWSYTVNGQMGDVAADKKLLIAGDTVEWKYTKIK